ncbi:MAG: glycosyltransferase family 4 protein, partial [Planktothrix sp.]
SESVRSQYNLSDYKILMFPGAPRPYKGIEDVLMALDILNQPDLRLVIVGGSPYDDYDQKLREKWGQWLISIPPLPVTKMPEIVAAAHIIVVPQRNHPSALAQFPLKLTDGMAMAKPVLSTNVGDIPDILGNTGYLVEPSSPEQIAEMIQHIFSDFDQAQEKGIAARKRCVEHYSIEAMANILASILSQY